MQTTMRWGRNWYTHGSIAEVPSMTMQISVADASDGPAISAFLEGLTVPARVPITVSRGRDCFALGRLRGGESFWLVAKDDEGIQAAMEVACIPMVWQGNLITVAYAAYAGVAQNWRKKGLLRKLTEEGEVIVRARGCTMGAYLHSRTNTAAGTAISRCERTAIAMEPMYISVLPASRRLAANRGLVLRTGHCGGLFVRGRTVAPPLRRLHRRTRRRPRKPPGPIIAAR